jgi:hypothetical protein
VLFANGAEANKQQESSDIASDGESGDGDCEECECATRQENKMEVGTSTED